MIAGSTKNQGRGKQLSGREKPKATYKEEKKGLSTLLYRKVTIHKVFFILFP